MWTAKKKSLVLIVIFHTQKCQRIMLQTVMDYCNTDVQNSSSHLNPKSTNASVYSVPVCAWRMAPFRQSWRLQLQTGCIYYISYISFLTDAFNPFVAETEERHINLLFHYDNCVSLEIQCGYIKPTLYPQASFGGWSLVALTAIIIGWSIILKSLSSGFSFYINIHL